MSAGRRYLPRSSPRVRLWGRVLISLMRGLIGCGHLVTHSGLGLGQTKMRSRMRNLSQRGMSPSSMRRCGSSKGCLVKISILLTSTHRDMCIKVRILTLNPCRLTSFRYRLSSDVTADSRKRLYVSRRHSFKVSSAGTISTIPMTSPRSEGVSGLVIAGARA